LAFPAGQNHPVARWANPEKQCQCQCQGEIGEEVKRLKGKKVKRARG
jgi:hypothetical protein